MCCINLCSLTLEHYLDLINFAHAFSVFAIVTNMKKLYTLFFISLILTGCTLFQTISENADLVGNITPDVNISNSGIINNIASDAMDASLGYVKDEFKEKWKETVTKFSESYNVTDFNYAISFGDNSVPYESKGRFKQAKGFTYYFADPKNTVETPPKIKGRNYNYSGEILYVTNRFRLSEISFMKALSVYEEAGFGDSVFTTLTVSNLGLLYHTTGRYALAKEYTMKALNKREGDESDRTGYAASLNNLAVLYKDMGLYSEADENIRKASVALEQTGNSETVNYAIILNNRAMICQMTGRYKEAEELMKQSLDIAGREIKKKSPTFVRLKVNLALLYQLTKRYEDAETIYLEAIDIKKKRLGTKHPDYAVLLTNTASLYMHMEQYDKVKELLTEAIEIYKKQFGDQHPSYAGALYDMGLFYLAQDSLDSAEKMLDQALIIRQNTLGDHHPAITETYEKLAVLNWQKKDFNQASVLFRKALDEYIYQVNTYFPAMNDYEKAQFREKIQSGFIRFYSFASQAKDQIRDISEDVYNYHIATKALLLNSSRKVRNRILNSGDKDLIAKYNEWQDLTGYVARLYSYSKEELREEQINLDSLEQVMKTLEKELTKSSELFKQSCEQQTITGKDIVQQLTTDEAAVEIIRVNKYDHLFQMDTVIYIGLVLKNDGSAPGMTVFNDGNRMESEYFDEYCEAVQTGNSMDKFDKYYWNELGALTKDVKKLYISVDGIYNQININTIQLSSGKYILEEKKVYFLTNTKDIISGGGVASERSKTAVLVGYPDYQYGMGEGKTYISPLPGTKTEVENIQSLLSANAWKTKMFIAEQASEKNIKKTSSPGIFHVATHGFYLEKKSQARAGTRAFGIEPMRLSENPLLRSGLLLAGAERSVQNINTSDNKDNDDGVLNAFEAMILDLDNTDIVVLSACQTGLGEIKTGEGVYGLQRSFQIAGASSVLTSLWKVSDKGTQDLMSAFYKYWLETGDKHDAFHKAMLDIKEQYKYPYYWGAFVLTGK